MERIASRRKTPRTGQTANTFRAGAKPEREPANQFYGDRNAGVPDRFGDVWFISTHVEDVAPDEMEPRIAEWQQQQ